MKKTAQEMFEEAGWKRDYDYSPEKYIVYEKECSCWDSQFIHFYLKDKYYLATYFDDPLLVDIETHKLITYQLEELGWI